IRGDEEGGSQRCRRARQFGIQERSGARAQGGASSGNSAPVFCRGRRPNVLRRRWSRVVSAGGRVCGQDFAGWEAGGHAGRATHEIRAGHQPQDRQSARPGRALVSTAARRRGDRMKRRKFISLLGGAAAWPLAVRAQQAAMPVIGYLSSRSPDDTTHLLAGFRQGLADGGFIERQNVTIEYRWALGRYDRLPELATELARLPVLIVAATGGEPAALAAKAATSTIPIVFATGTDPVKAGLVASYNRPGGNANGINFQTVDMEAKRLGLLHELIPQAKTIAFLYNPKFAAAEGQLHDVREAAQTLGLQVNVLHASTDDEINAAFRTMVQQQTAALVLAADPFFDTRRSQLVVLAAYIMLPAIYQFREYAAAGGLMSYGIDAVDAYRQVGIYTARILKGAKPVDLPVLQPTKFELIINLKTAKALGLEIPPMLLARADEVIEGKGAGSSRCLAARRWRGRSAGARY